MLRCWDDYNISVRSAETSVVKRWHVCSEVEVLKDGFLVYPDVSRPHNLKDTAWKNTQLYLQNMGIDRPLMVSNHGYIFN